MLTTKYELTEVLDQLLVIYNEEKDEDIKNKIDYLCNILNYRIFSFGPGLRTLIISEPGDYELELTEEDYNMFFHKSYTKTL